MRVSRVVVPVVVIGGVVLGVLAGMQVWAFLAAGAA